MQLSHRGLDRFLVSVREDGDPFSPTEHIEKALAITLENSLISDKYIEYRVAEFVPDIIYFAVRCHKVVYEPQRQLIVDEDIG